jgi:hypothetical protein
MLVRCAWRASSPVAARRGTSAPHPATSACRTAREPVETTQVAPTILQLLGIRPDALQAVQIEHTRPLPLG